MGQYGRPPLATAGLLVRLLDDICRLSQAADNIKRMCSFMALARRHTHRVLGNATGIRSAITRRALLSVDD